MANTASARKRIRTTARRHARNVMVRSQLKTLVKKSAQSVNAKNEASKESLAAALKALDQAAAKGIIHKNQAARRKSRLVRRFNIANGIGTRTTVQ
ncbi:MULTISPECIES: 30S ribosomal protein S20 [Herpetosiphon]|uniref:Small ribosomal subunit protein bS20 n=1 Tax=Herpetosiphon geysericola TaxID=70996 RepID=A0A0P6Y9V6_9CHLR|nr:MULTISPECIES: 30S ribosomal protein S20 [Herpetosiphon]KPL86013.1 30S ribosomal protein S20 [Herpetosiphon geysericola]MBM7844290.1 small subunit ribosomal protein S20 [Herpetosiphon giganteus]